jgi:uncharacterized protein (DUF1810 family)
MNPGDVLEKAADPFNLQRFLDAQRGIYKQALAELKTGQKRSHWMWFIFPQIAGLGFSYDSQFYAIRSLSEACAYLEHPILGPRLVECTAAVLALEGRTAGQVFGPIDVLKFRSSLTLFAQVSASTSIFHLALDKYYSGEADSRTLDQLLPPRREGR